VGHRLSALRNGVWFTVVPRHSTPDPRTPSNSCKQSDKSLPTMLSIFICFVYEKL